MPSARAPSLGSATMTTTDPNIVGVGRVPRVARCVAGKLFQNFDFGTPSGPPLAAASKARTGILNGDPEMGLETIKP